MDRTVTQAIIRRPLIVYVNFDPRPFYVGFVAE